MTLIDGIENVLVGGVSVRTQVIAVLASGLMLAIIGSLIRKQRLKPGYSIGWFLVGIAGVAFAMFSPLLSYFAQVLGISYAPAAFLLILVGGLFALALHYSVLVTRFDRQIADLAQEHALLRAEVEELQRRQLRSRTSRSVSVPTHEKVNV